MDYFNVLEESCYMHASCHHLPRSSLSLKSFPFVLLSKIVDAVLSNILLKNLNSSQLCSNIMLRGTIFTITHAILEFEISVARWACPSDEHWLEINLVDYWLDIFRHASNEIERFVTAACVPVLHVDAVVLVSVWLEPSFQSCVFSILLRG